MDKSETLESLKASIKSDAKAVLDMATPPELPIMVNHPLVRTGDLEVPFEAELCSVLEQGALDLVRFQAREAAQQSPNGRLRPSQRLAIQRATFSFLEGIWLSAGGTTCIFAASWIMKVSEGIDPGTARICAAVSSAISNLTKEDVLSGGVGTGAVTESAERSADQLTSQPGNIVSHLCQVGVLNDACSKQSPSLSPRDWQVCQRVGAERFRTLTNAEIMREVSVKKDLLVNCELKWGDAAKLSFDRIRRAMRYPLSRAIVQKRVRLRKV